MWVCAPEAHFMHQFPRAQLPPSALAHCLSKRLGNECPRNVQVPEMLLPLFLAMLWGGEWMGVARRGPGWGSGLGLQLEPLSLP